MAEPPRVVPAARRRALASRMRRSRTGTAWRDEPVERKLAYVRRQGGDPGPGEEDGAMERVLGGPDLLPGSWLARGVSVADSVAMIETSEGTATGFLVSPWLLLTNRHVLGDADAAATARASFRYVLDARGRANRVQTVDLDPQRCFLAGRELDYALVAVATTTTGAAPGETFGFVPLIATIGKIVLGQPVNIVQHPQGRPREVAVRENRLLDVDDDHLVYGTDTDSGSSGSPAFNDRWELVALHRRGVEARDAAGRTVDLDGHPVDDSTPDDRRRWIANEGVRVSAILADVAGRRASGSEAGLVDTLTEARP